MFGVTILLSERASVRESQMLKTVVPASILIALGWIAALASPAGDACRKEICDSAVAGCMRADQPLNPFARAADEKKQYCAQFLPDCMSRSIVPDLPWYSPEMVARFLKCPL